MARVEHQDGQMMVQRITRPRRASSWRSDTDDVLEVEVISTRERITTAVQDTWHIEGDRYWHPFRPNALLTADQLWRVFIENPDVRHSVESVARRGSTWDHGVTPLVDEQSDEHEAAVAQCEEVMKFLENPNVDDTWQTFWYKLIVDALVFPHGAFENAFTETITVGTVEAGGFVEEFVPVHGPTIHPQRDRHHRISGYVQDTGWNGQANSARDKLLPLRRDQITLLQIGPNTRSAYAVPIIETIVKQVTTLWRAATRIMEEFDSEVPPGFLVLTGKGSPQTEAIQQEQKGRHRGQDKKLRILRNPGGTAPAQWLRLERAWRELELQPLLKDAQRTVWRGFGVTPAEQGDVQDANRSNMDAQLDVGSSHLLEPMLEGIEAIVNRRMVPLIVQALARDRNARVLCGFSFDRTHKLSAEDELKLAEADKVRLESGQRNPNELRIRDGLPAYEGGDIYRIAGIRVGDAGDGDGNGDGNGDDGEPEPEPEPEADSDADADTSNRPLIDYLGGNRSTAAFRPGTLHDRLATLYAFDAMCQTRDPALVVAAVGADSLRLEPFNRQREQLPSDWQEAGRFSGVRTLDLVALFDDVTGYRGTVQPLWDSTRARILAITGAHFRAKTLGSGAHLAAVNDLIEEMRVNWTVATQARYASVAESAGDQAREHVPNPDAIGDAPKETADAYFVQAIAFLDALMTDLKARMAANIQAVSIGRAEGPQEERAPQTADPDLNPDSELGELLVALESGFDAHEHRIDNWSGRLVELASLVMVASLLAGGAPDPEGLAEGEPAEVDDGLPSGGAEWWVEWVSVLDTGTCDTCDREASLGLRPAASLNTVPGGDTECRARCRCVLVFWTREEVEAGNIQVFNP